MKKIEEVARAIFRRRNCWFGAPTWETTSDDVRASFLDDAKCAVGAVGNWHLTDAQCNAGFKAGEFAGHGPEHPQWNAMRRIFPAIIDAALNEGKE